VKGDHTHTRRFNSHFPCKPGLASSPLDSVPLILIV